MVFPGTREDARNTVRVGVRVPLPAHLFSALIGGDKARRDV